MKRRVIGLISGTSVDGIDAALVEIVGGTSDLYLTLLRGQTYPYPAELRSQILAVCAGESLSMAALAELDDAIATAFATAAIAIQADLPPADLIGSHGQTVFHRPRDTRLGYSLQLGRGAAIAQQTGLPTVSNFRVGDIAMGGEGAPLVPKVDAYLLSHPQHATAVQNIGGIGNVTYLPPRRELDGDAQAWEATVLGWDTGPGNSLLDLAVSQLSDGRLTYDRDGAWAAQGTPNSALVAQWLQHPFFQQAPPKSTGRELFGVEYLAQCVQDCQAAGVTAAADILATLTDLTAAAIAHSYQTFLPQLPERVLVCGGGSKNGYLMQRLQHHLPRIQIDVTTAAGVDADFKEAIAFAVLADWRMQQNPGNLPSVTGARCAALLGEIHLPPPSDGVHTSLNSV